MKRKFGEFSKFISATKTRNFLTGNQFDDIIESQLTRTCSRISKFSSSNDGDFTSFIMEQGNIFEDKIMNILKGRFTKEELAWLNYKNISDENYEKTINCIKNKIPIIYGGVLKNENNNTAGIPDLIVRCDYVDKIFKSSKFCVDFSDYIIIDIKFTTLNLKSNGLNILNYGSIPAYKGQLYIYTEALNLHQNFKQNKALILGRGFKFTKGSKVFKNRDPFERFGLIDYTPKIGLDEEYINKTRDALDWVSLVNSGETKSWNFKNFPFERPEMYPNMSSSSSTKYSKFKDEINEKWKEITSVWMCGPENRSKAHKQGIFTWNDENCNAEVLGFKKEGSYFNTINKILELNKSTELISYPSDLKEKYPLFNSKENNSLESFDDFYIDIETTSDCIANKDIPVLIFMIGIFNSRKNEYKNFLVKELTIESQNEMIDEFKNYIKESTYHCDEQERIPRLIHWSAFEKTMLSSQVQENAQFVDLCKIFTKAPIVIKGSLNFGLKNIAKSMKKHGMINSTWDSLSSTCDGLMASINIFKAFESNTCINAYGGGEDESKKLINDIINYNEIDVKVMYEIVEYLRNKLN